MPAGARAGVLYWDADGREQAQRARAVVSAANGAETPRLLLMSESSRFPHGLANSSGKVGKYLMFNGQSYASGTVRAPAQRVQERPGHARPARLLRRGSGARLLRRRRARRALRSAAPSFGRCGYRSKGRVGPEFKARAEGVTAHGGGITGTRRRCRSRRTASRSTRTQGPLGPARDPRDLQRPSGRYRDHALPPGPRPRDAGSRRCARSGRRPSPSSVGVPHARHVPHG